jgi:hypothetical protein
MRVVVTLIPAKDEPGPAGTQATYPDGYAAAIGLIRLLTDDELNRLVTTDLRRTQRERNGWPRGYPLPAAEGAVPQ